MPKYPNFRLNMRGLPVLFDSPEAINLSSSRAKSEGSKWVPPIPPSQVEAEAKERVKERGGDISDRRDVLGEFLLQGGKFRGQSFRWLMENSPGYAGWYISKTIEDDLAGVSSNLNQDKNKKALVEYATLFKESRAVVDQKITNKKVKEDWMKRVPQITSTGRTATVSASTSRFAPLLSGPQLSTEALRRKMNRLTTPPKFSPNLKKALHHVPSPVSGEDLILFEAVEEFERSSGISHNSGKASTASTVKRKVLQETEQECATKVPKVIHIPIDEEFEKMRSDHTAFPQRPLASSFVQEHAAGSRLGATQLAVSDCLGEESEITVQDSSEPTLYAGWSKTLPKVDHHWISKQFFGMDLKGNPELKMDRITQLWHSPPAPSLNVNVRNKMDRYFGHKLFMWMPVNIWRVKLHCPHATCNGILRRSGIHQKTRLVLDVDSYYIIASEYLQCAKCNRKVISWAKDLLKQLDLDRRLLFPCQLSAKYACDLKVVQLLRQRSLGNSSSLVLRHLVEAHSERYLKECHHYLQACKKFKQSAGTFGTEMPSFDHPPTMTTLPDHRWLMKMYQLDVLHRIDYVKSALTSTFGDVLKLDSTKKITKKLAGRSAHTAMWATNVGNEFGQVLISVLTTNEGQGLQSMISGLMNRYQTSNVPAPKLLYVDRDCCGAACVQKFFDDWPSLIIRLDIWHFMRRLSIGCTTDAHALYGTFMSRLSQCIFKWEETDVQRLKEAKRAEMTKLHIPHPTDKEVSRRISKEELSLHCRRMTRGAEETLNLISALINSLSGDKGLDTMGVPLLDRERMTAIWTVQQRHVCCIQDPEGVQLYTEVGHVIKGGVRLPKYRCARGSTSLESFHLHMNRFIPGTLASDVNFQVYLLDGLFRWNEDRRRSAVGEQDARSLFSYDGVLQNSCNELAEEVLGQRLVSGYEPPRLYTGELIGIEYLYSQSSEGTLEYNQVADTIENEEGEEGQEDDSLSEEVEHEDLTVPCLEESTQLNDPAQQPDISSVDQFRESSTEEESAAKKADESDLGPDNIPGYKKVLNLANFLVTLKDVEDTMSSDQIDQVIKLWSNLDLYDKARTVFPPRYSKSPDTSRFKSPKKLNVAEGVTSMKRAILGPNTGPASWPDCNRYVEATVEKLLSIFPRDQRSKSKPTITRWILIKSAYERIAKALYGSRRVMEKTEITLPRLNTKTIQQWYNKKEKEVDLQTCLQGLSLPAPSFSGTGAPPPKSRPANLPSAAAGMPFNFPSAPDTAGQLRLKMKRQPITLMPKGPAPLFPLLFTPSTGTLQVMPSASLGAPERLPVQQKPRTPVVFHCKQCGQERTGENHRQYMGYRYCAVTAQVTFEEWRAELQSRNVHRKKERR